VTVTAGKALPEFIEARAPSAAAPISARALVSEIIAGSPPGTLLDAQAVLREHPELANHKSALMELAYEDFCRRDDLGMVVEPEEFATRFPTICRSLLHQIGIHQLLVEGVPPDRSSAAQAWPSPGSTWLDFELIEELGRGAFSRVFLAREQTLGKRLVVVKATPLGPREAQTLGLLQHPHVVPVHSVQRDDALGLTAVCMPYLSRVSLFDVMDALFSLPEAGHVVHQEACPVDEMHGSTRSNESKSQWFRRGAAARRPPRRAVELLEAVARLNAVAGDGPSASVEAAWPRGWCYADAVLHVGLQLAQALQHAHCQGVLHGDVKPSNVLITGSGRALLLDFNLAILGGDSAPFIAGTLPYMAPEQLRGLAAWDESPERSLDERSDIFSLGLTLFELLYGQPAFGPLPRETSRERVAGRLLERQSLGVTHPHGRARDADRRLGQIIVRCLAYDPARRPQSMEELAQLLSAELKPSRRFGRWWRANRRLTLGATSLFCAAALAAGAWQATRDPYPIREWKQGEAAYDRGDDAAAIEHLTVALRHDPLLVDARLLRGLAYARRKDLIAARADLDPLTDQVRDGRAATALAHAYAVISVDPGMAGLYFQQAVDQGYRSAEIYNNLGNCLYQTGRMQDSAVALETAVSLNPRLGAAQHNLAGLEFRIAVQKRRMPDTTAIEEALRLGPQSTELDRDAALIYALRSQFAVGTDQKEHELEKVFAHLQSALAHGLSRSNLDDIARMYPELTSDRRWQHLENGLQIGSKFVPANLLIDLLPELRAQCRSLAARVTGQ
jgi:serine/threonine protein kinase/Tfp pilus assembly protein PilF